MKSKGHKRGQRRGLGDFLAGGGFRSDRSRDDVLPLAPREKMSEVIEKFIQPYISSAPTEVECKNLIAVASIAWNASLLPEHDRKAFLDNNDIYRSDADFRRILDDMIQRKLKHYSAIRRFILEYEVAGSGNKLHLTVLSTVV